MERGGLAGGLEGRDSSADMKMRSRRQSGELQRYHGDADAV